MNVTWRWLVLLLLCGALVRLALLTGYEPVVYPDTGTYLAAARDLVSGDHSVSQGRRTPGYPLLVAALGEDHDAIVAAQVVAGLLIASLLFTVALHLGASPGLAFIVGLSYHLNLQQVFLEAALITETLSTLLVVAAISALLAVRRRILRQQSAAGGLLLLGLLVGTTVLVRPQFVFLPLLVPAVLLLDAVRGSGRWRWPGATATGHVFLVSLPTAALILAWCLVVWVKVGVFTMSTQSGFGLMNHSVNYIELAPERDAVIRDIMLEHRARRLAVAGQTGNTVWYAWPEIREKTGLSLPEASREFKRISAELFVAHPWLYAKGVVASWISFWTVPILWQPEQVHPPWRASLLEGVWWVEHKLLRLANLGFVLLVAAVTTSAAIRRRVGWGLGLSAISALVLASSAIQALADLGAGSRYHVTTQSLVVLVLLVAGWQAHQRRAGAPAHA